MLMGSIKILLSRSIVNRELSIVTYLAMFEIELFK